MTDYKYIDPEGTPTFGTEGTAILDSIQKYMTCISISLFGIREVFGKSNKLHFNVIKNTLLSEIDVLMEGVKNEDANELVGQLKQLNEVLCTEGDIARNIVSHTLFSTTINRYFDNLDTRTFDVILGICKQCELKGHYPVPIVRLIDNTALISNSPSNVYLDSSLHSYYHTSELWYNYITFSATDDPELIKHVFNMLAYLYIPIIPSGKMGISYGDITAYCNNRNVIIEDDIRFIHDLLSFDVPSTQGSLEALGDDDTGDDDTDTMNDEDIEASDETGAEDIDDNNVSEETPSDDGTEDNENENESPDNADDDTPEDEAPKIKLVFEVANDTTIDDLFYKLGVSKYIETVDPESMDIGTYSLLKIWNSRFLFLVTRANTEKVLKTLKIKLK